MAIAVLGFPRTMLRLWTLEGLSLVELIRRTVVESWKDSVFGQGGRMAFYQFLALFPALAVFLAAGTRIPHLVDYMRGALQDFSRHLFPAQVSQLLENVLDQPYRRVLTGPQLLFTCMGTLWAAFNSTWAMIYGLNRAYEVREHRRRWKLALTVCGLTVAMALTGCVAILMIFGAVRSEMVEYTVLVAALSFAFSLLYRFAPNVPDHEWRWSTPGAILALVLWLGATFAARFYFGRVNDYSRTYGHLNGVAMLLLWLYVTNGAILMGGEMNSEIEKAAASRRSSG
jgi:membrane protein